MHVNGSLIRSTRDRASLINRSASTDFPLGPVSLRSLGFGVGQFCLGGRLMRGPRRRNCASCSPFPAPSADQLGGISRLETERIAMNFGNDLNDATKIPPYPRLAASVFRPVYTEITPKNFTAPVYLRVAFRRQHPCPRSPDAQCDRNAPRVGISWPVVDCLLFGTRRENRTSRVADATTRPLAPSRATV